jgi:hypothetical protein
MRGLAPVRGEDQVLEVALNAMYALRTDKCGQPIIAVLGGHLPTSPPRARSIYASTAGR